MLFMLTIVHPTSGQSLAVIPVPLKTTNMPGTLVIKDGGLVSYPINDAGARFAAEHFVELMRKTGHISLVAKTGLDKSADIVITRTIRKTELDNREAYDLHVTSRQVKISAATDAGLFYGTVTLWQMLTEKPITDGTAELHCVQIHDQPELRWRGIMLDSARHVQSVDFIRNLLDWMSLEKLNVLHWHLTDDQGWRLEIKQYPKLTSVGGYRELYSPTGKFGGAADINADSLRYGGYYTQEQVRMLVAYAAKLNITIVPEIEMPGHETAAIAAYPEMGPTNAPPTTPASTYGIHPNLFNVDDSTFTFIENVLTEVMDLFPSEYIHVGGDEAIKSQWQSSAEIQAKMKSLGIRNEDQLQSYFIKRIDSFITAHHRRTIGWDEILQGGLAPGAAVMSWHGIQGGIDAAKQGHDAVLTPTRPLYLNYRQSEAADEAPGRWALNTLADVYGFNPAPENLTPEERSHILGVQGSLWSEYMINTNIDEWMIFPRAAALAEIGWAPGDHRNWNDFVRRMVPEFERYKALGINYDPAIYRVRSTETITADTSQVEVALSNQAKYGTIRYTTDGSNVTSSSKIYESQITLPLPTHLRAATFFDSLIPRSELDRQLNAMTIRLRYSQDLRLCSTSPVIGMAQDLGYGDAANMLSSAKEDYTNPSVSLANYQNPCWIYTDADLTGVHQISVGVMSLPYLFADRNGMSPPLGVAHTPSGELEVHLDTCTGPLLTTLPFAPAVDKVGVIQLNANVTATEGKHDLCFKVVRPTVNPLWVVDWIQLYPTN